MAEVIDINVFPTIETVDVTIETIIDNVLVTVQPTTDDVNINITPNLITINVNTVTGGGTTPPLQEVMETGRSYNQTIGDYTYRLEFDEADGAYISVNDNDLNTISGFQLQQGATLYFTDGISGKSTSVYCSDFGAGLVSLANTFGQNVLNIPFRTSGSGISYFQPPNNKAAGSYTLAITDDIPSLTGYVPYTGATTNVNLGEFELKAGQVTLDTTPTGTAAVTTTRWNDSLGTSETTLKGGNVILKNGIDLVARVVNKVTPNTTLTKAAYQVVRISGAQGQRLAVNLAQANNDNNSADTLGIVTETIATNQEGFIMTVGQLEGINTTGSLQGETWADGDVLYLSPTTAGRITNIKPTGATGHIVILGYVEHAHINQGKIYVKIMNGWELDELHNVYISSVANNQILTYESATQLWKNKNLNQIVSERRNANNTSNNSINYCGTAPNGSSESSAVWTIKRLTIAASGSITIATATNVAWTNRQSATYI